MSVDIARLQLEADSTQVRKASTDLQNLERQSGRTEQATDKFSNGLKTMAVRLGAAAAAYVSVSQAMNLVVSSVREYAVFEQQMKRLEAQIQATGRTGQTTANDLERMAQAIDKATLQSAQGVRNAQAILMSFRNVSTDMMERILYVASDVSEVMGQDITSAARQMALALEDPERGISMLRRTGTTFTEQQKEMVIQLYKSGDALAAQSAILDVMESQYGGTAKKAAEGLAGSMDLLARNTANLRIQIGQYLAPVIKDLTDDLAETTDQLTGSAGLMYGIAATIDAIAIFSRTFELAGKTVALIFASLNAAAWELTGILVAGPIKALEYIIELYNKIPKLPDIELPKGLTGFADTIIASTEIANQTVVEATKDIADLLQRPLPGNAIRDSFGEIEEQAEKTTKETKKHLKTLSEINREYAESLKDIQIEWMNFDAINMTDKERRMAEDKQAQARHVREILDDRERAVQDALDEETRMQKEARREYEREWERVYDDMHKFAADTFYDAFKGIKGDWGDLLDTMKDMFVRAFANMAAEAAMTNIFKPIMNQLAGSMFGDFVGLPSNGTGNLSSIPGLGFLGGTIPGTATIGSELGWGAAAAQDIGAMASSGVTWGSALGAGALGSLGYSTLGGAIGLPQSPYSGITSGLGAAGMGAYGGSLASMTGLGFLGGPIGIGLGALLGGVLGGVVDDDPSPRIGMAFRGRETGFSEYGINTFSQDIPDAGPLNKAIGDYFDEKLGAIDEIIGNQFVKNLVMDRRGPVSNYKWLDPEQFGNDPALIMKQWEKDLFRNLRKDLTTEILGGEYSGKFSLDFFSDIKEQGEGYFDAFARFAEVAQVNENFFSEFTDMVDNLGYSGVEAFGYLEDSVQDIIETTKEAEAAEKDLVRAREAARKTIDDLIRDLEGGSLAPGQSLEYFQNQYDTALASLQGATTADDYQKYSRDLAGITSDYLEFASDYGPSYRGNPTELYNTVLSQLKGLEGFSGGGISTGPESGYPIMAHGTEAHVPTQNGNIPVVVQGGGDVYITIDTGALQQLLREGHIKMHRTDEETHNAVRREVA